MIVFLNLSQHARQATEGNPPALRVDALVAAGNALASAAELAPTANGALQLLHGAQEAYAAALARDEDAGTLSNAADAWVAAAQRLGEAGRRDEAATLFSQAMAAYQRSCELSSSEEGDDLPGETFAHFVLQRRGCDMRWAYKAQLVV